MRLRNLIFTILLAGLLAGCANTAGGATLPPFNTATPAPDASPLPAETATATAPPALTPSATATAGPTPTATPDLRLDPADWKNWPVVPDRISARAREVYALGLAMGNDPRRFSKVGDCQAIKEVLMGVYDKPLQYRLVENAENLQETIDHFAGSFDRDGQGVKGGYNAAAVLSPIWADPAACQPGETPIECEYRTYRPSIVIISLEVWWDGRTPERYEQYMRQIIDYYLEKGVVPVLSTKADNVEGNHAINLATAKLAHEYDLPLWNWWLAAQRLPNGGLDPSRPDGFHISYEAWTPRGHTALEALDAVWRMLNAGELAQPTATPEPQESGAGDLPAANLVGPLTGLSYEPDASTGANQVLLALGERSERSGEQAAQEGVYLLELATGKSTRLLDGSVLWQDSSAGGKYQLASRQNELYFIRSGDWASVSADQAGSAGSALFLPDARSLAYIGQAAGQPPALYLMSHPNPPVLADTAGIVPGRLLGSTPDGVFWAEACTGACPAENVYYSALAGAPAVRIGAFSRPVVSPDGSRIAAIEKNQNGEEVLSVTTVESGSKTSTYLAGEAWGDIAWSADGQMLAVTRARRSDYTGKVAGYSVWVLNAANLSVGTPAELEGLNAVVRFAPDGSALYRAATRQAADGSYTIYLDRMLLSSGRVEVIETSLHNEAFIWVAGLELVP